MYVCQKIALGRTQHNCTSADLVRGDHIHMLYSVIMLDDLSKKINNTQHHGLFICNICGCVTCTCVVGNLKRASKPYVYHLRCVLHCHMCVSNWTFAFGEYNPGWCPDCTITKVTGWIRVRSSAWSWQVCFWHTFFLVFTCTFILIVHIIQL